MTSTSPARRVRVVVGEAGPDGPDTGAQVVARALRDAGHEVVYTGPCRTPEQLVETAIQEDADLIGLYVLPGAHLAPYGRLTELLVERDASDVVVFGGGTLSEEDVALLERTRVAQVFAPGTPTTDVTGWVAEHFSA